MKYLKSFESATFKSYDFDPRTGKGISLEKIYEYEEIEIPYSEAIKMSQEELKKLLVGKLASFREIVMGPNIIGNRMYVKRVDSGKLPWHYVYDVFITNELSRGTGRNEKIIYIWSYNIGNSPSYKDEQYHKVLNAGSIVYLSFDKKKSVFKDWDPFGEEVSESLGKINSESFIPIELRGEIMPNFEWTADMEMVCYTKQDRDLNPNTQKYKNLMSDEDYLEEIKNKVVGHLVNFYQFVYGNRNGNLLYTTKEKRIVINDVSYNARGVLIFNTYDHFGGAIDERKPITIFKREPKIFDPEDPFGEEF